MISDHKRTSSLKIYFSVLVQLSPESPELNGSEKLGRHFYYVGVPVASNM